MSQASLDGLEQPIFKDESYPEILRELAELLDRELRDAGIEAPHAIAVAETVIEQVRERFGGSPIYISKGMTYRQQRRMWAMWDAFRGDNHLQLARQFGMGLSQVYRTLQVVRRLVRTRQQPDLFAGADAARESKSEGGR